MSTVILIGFGMIFLALFIGFAAIGGLTRESTGVNRSIAVLEAITAAPEEMTRELDASFSDRVLFPLLARSQQLGRRLTPEDASDRIREKLELAGNPLGWTVERVMAGKVVGFGAALVVSLILSLLMGLSFLPTLGFVVVASLAGYMAPNMYLHQQTYDRVGEAPARAPRRHRPAHHLRGVRPRLRRRLRPGGAEHGRPAVRGVRPHAAGDADRTRSLRGAALAGRADQPRRPALVRQRHGAGRRLRHPRGSGAPGAVLGDPGQASPVGRGAGPEGAREDPGAADLLHPAVPVHRRARAGGHLRS